MKKKNLSPGASKILLAVGCLILAIIFWFIIKYTGASAMQAFVSYGFC